MAYSYYSCRPPGGHEPRKTRRGYYIIPNFRRVSPLYFLDGMGIIDYNKTAAQIHILTVCVRFNIIFDRIGGNFEMSDYETPLDVKLKELAVDPEHGLSREEAQKRLLAEGENVLLGKKRPNLFQRFVMQLADVMVIILIAAAAVSFVVALIDGSGEFIDSIVILAIVILNACLGVSQESKAERSLDALKEMSAPTAKVMRGGAVEKIPSAQVVRGDIVLLEAGDLIPADMRLVESASLKCEESALTGESVPAEKDAGAKVDGGAPLGDRFNMVYSGCIVTYGRAVGAVTATGMNTEMGRIADLLNREETEATPLQRRLAQLGKYLGILALAICFIIFLIGVFQKMPPMEILMTSVSLAVAAIPEGLTAVVTVVLALGVQRMVGHNAIIRRLPAVETLGSASVICSDKTGTLTQNRMTVRQVWAAGKSAEEMSAALGAKAQHVLRLCALCNDGRIERDGDGGERMAGDPTETAIVAAAAVCGMEKAALDVEFKRVYEIPFDSDRKRMTTVHEVGGKLLAIVKGGFDVVVPLCGNVDPERAGAVNAQMAEGALRVLAVACKELERLPENPSVENLESGLTFMGLIGMLDPPRDESREAVRVCHEAGIKTVMITGDHITTACAIAKDLGIMQHGDRAVSGAELAAMPQRQLEKDIERYRVYARVSPEDKIRIVSAWQARGAVVSMTGDGVNDAPALKAADIGCAMGITGTDVAKGAADMVLTDDNFSTIVEAVREGRGIYDNIKKTVQFLLGSNLGEIFAVFFAMIFGWGTPLLAIHLLMVNVVTDALPALALGVEPVEKDIMKRAPIPREQGIFANRLGVVIVLQGFLVGALTLVGYFIGRFVEISPLFAPSQQIGMTMAFLVLSLSQLVQAFNCRSTQSLFKIGFFSNKTMMRGFCVSLLIVLALTLVPFLESLFRLVDISMWHWLLVLGLCLVPLVITEIVKAFISLRKRMV